MIHYTLLPKIEMKKLRREYRTRLIILFSFFISFAVLIGICSLAPAYIYSYSQEKEALGKAQSIQKSLKESGTDEIWRDLRQASEIITRLKGNTPSKPFGDIVASIIADKNTNIKINSFNFTEIIDASSTPIFSVNIAGKSGTREGLVSFKKKLETDDYIQSVELPVSDLAKSKDIDFSMRITIKPQK